MIADGHAERRNLTVLSIAIIVYFLGGATLKGHDLNLPMVSITFTNTWVLVVMVWVSLAWFQFRYWQEARANYRRDTNSKIESHAKGDGGLKRYIQKESGHQENESIVISIERFNRSPSKTATWSATYSPRNKNSPSTGVKASNTIDFDGLSGKLSVIRFHLKLFRLEGSILAYWSPFILSAVAWILGAYHLGEICWDTYQAWLYPTSAVTSLMQEAL
ncbi:membrane hypothetical protein [Marinobacter salarius]|uniref:hypothetical protein n=1 Tax=Marinobacter salarius TaxID=1420917 RepID=UPI00125BC511|nr:hypothetical protein [Marinobacter salarius]VVT32437.1 membrane hypothetical protein [Marinobacter salarius]VXA92700.1 membrane hypothetical protein [Marinobacter salarius]